MNLWRRHGSQKQAIGAQRHSNVLSNYVKMTFAKGAFVPDPPRLVNSSLEGNLRRAIDLHEGDKIDEKAFKALIRAAVKLNAPAGR